MTIDLKIRRVAYFLVAVTVVLALGHFFWALPQLPYDRLVHLGSERSLGTWFSIVLGLACSIAAYLVGRSVRPGWFGSIWAVLAAGLLLYSVEELIGIHEGASRIIGAQVRANDNVMAGTPIVGLVTFPLLLGFLYLLRKRSATTAFRFIAGGLLLFWVAAFAIEELELWNNTGEFFLQRFMSVADSDVVLVGVQETLEIGGLALVLLGLLREMVARSLPVTLTPQMHFDASNHPADIARDTRMESGTFVVID